MAAVGLGVPEAGSGRAHASVRLLNDHAGDDVLVVAVDVDELADEAFDDGVGPLGGGVVHVRGIGDCVCNSLIHGAAHEFLVAFWGSGVVLHVHLGFALGFFRRSLDSHHVLWRRRGECECEYSIFRWVVVVCCKVAVDGWEGCRRKG